MANILKIVARNSNLSLIQIQELFSALPSVSYSTLGLESYGDKNKNISLMGDRVEADFFTRELDNAVLRKEADIAIHSAKDLPYPLPKGLELYCLTEASDKTDSLVSLNNRTLNELPLRSRVGTSSKTRKKELLKLRPDLEIVSIRGTIEERLQYLDRKEVEAIIVASCALKRLDLFDRCSEILPFETHPLQGNLAVVGHVGNDELKRIFKPIDIRSSYGKVTLVGFGPGNPDLLTVAGLKALQSATVIFHDDLIDKSFLDNLSAKKVYVGKRRGQHSFHQDEINKLIYKAAISGEQVVRLKGGDPMVFAHGREEIDFLKSRLVEVSVIPGISSGISLASYTHIPLTHRGLSSSVAFVSGHSFETSNLPVADTLVFYMGGANVSAIAERLIKSGKDKNTLVALVHNVSFPDQKTFYSTLDELRFSLFKYPTPLIFIVGEVVALEYQSGHTQKLLVTGTNPDYNQTDENIHQPLIRAVNTDVKQLNINKNKLVLFDWIIFTSKHGVSAFFEYLQTIEFDIRQLAKTKIASVGVVTSAELKKHHIKPDIESDTQSAEGLVNYFKNNNITYQSILLPRSDKGLKYLSKSLESLGNKISDVPIYRNEKNKDAEKIDLSDFHKVFFASPSGVDAFLDLYKGIPADIQCVCKGETTRQHLKKVLDEKI